MSFTRINNSDFNGKGALSLPDQPTIAAQELKRKFDEPAREVVAPKVNVIVDELEAPAAASNLGATAPAGRTGATVQAIVESVSSALSNVEGVIPGLVANEHAHPNKAELDKFSEDATGKPLYDGNVIGETDYSSLNNKPQINSVTLTGNKSTSDLGLASTADIPTKVSELTNDSDYATASDVATAVATKSNVVWSQQVTTGQRIATVTIDGTITDVYAPTGGGGGGGAVDSVNGMTGIVVLNVEDLADANFASISPNDAIVRNSSNEWVNIPLPPSALSGSYADLSGKPTLATVATSGSYNDLSNKPTIPAAQVNSDWNASSGVAEILNKPTIPTVEQTYSASSPNAQSGVAVASAISGKADSSDLDDWTATYTTLDGTTAVFSGLNDAYGYDLYCEDKLIGISNIAKTGSGTNVTLTYTVTGASIGDVFKLRILK